MTDHRVPSEEGAAGNHILLTARRDDVVVLEPHLARFGLVSKPGWIREVLGLMFQLETLDGRPLAT